jgi:ribosome-associated protein YbcJ (S4-like RNA binding protein)
MEGILNRRRVATDRPNARRKKLRVNGVVEIAEQTVQLLLSYLGSRDLD